MRQTQSLKLSQKVVVCMQFRKRLLIEFNFIIDDLFEFLCKLILMKIIQTKNLENFEEKN